MTRSSAQKEEPGVYASLRDLVALQFKARGFSFLLASADPLASGRAARFAAARAAD